MHASKLNVRSLVVDMGRRVHIGVTTRFNALAQKQWDHPWQDNLMRSTAVVTFLGLTAGMAHADGFAELASKGADQGDSIKTYAGRLFAAAGFLGASYGGYNWWRKGKEGENSQIKATQIVGPLLGGMALGATGVFLVKAGETIGVTGASQGQLPK